MNRRRGGAPKKRQQPYPTPTKKPDTPPPVPTAHTVEDEEEEDEEEEQEEEEEEEEKEDDKEDDPGSGTIGTPILVVVSTTRSRGGPLTITSLDKDDLMMLSLEEQREQQRRVKKIQSRIHKERVTKEEFARLMYTVEWYARHEDVQIYRDTSYYSISGSETIDFIKEYDSMLARAMQWSDQKGKVAKLVEVNATLTNYGKDKTLFRLDWSDIANFWHLKIKKAMRLKHSTRPKKSTVSFKVLVEF